MSEAAFAELNCAPAICRSAGTAARGSAARLLYGCHAVPEAALPATTTVITPGRVQSLGRFGSHDVRAALASALPAALRDSLRPDFEWYACRGAFFHTDAHYGEVLFGAWCVAGPQREIVFSRAGLRVAAAPGDWIVFDPFEPHAVLDRGASHYRREHYEDAVPSLFLGFELELDAGVRAAFGIGPAPMDAPVLASNVAVNAETGVLG